MTADGPGLDRAPWDGLDGPSVAASAAALQLLPGNAPALVRADRLAAVGCALPAVPGAPAPGPSALRALLAHPLVTDQRVLAQEDTYDDVFVEEVMFHGGPRLAVQGLPSRSAGIARALLEAVFGPSGQDLPPAFRRDAGGVARALLVLSDSVCRAAGLTRLSEAGRGRLTRLEVPARARLDDLRAAVTFDADRLSRLSALLGQGWQDALGPLVVDSGRHPLALAEATDEGLLLTPLLRTGPGLVVASPGGLMGALRHRLVVLAAGHGCRDALAAALRTVVVGQVQETLLFLGAEPSTAAEASDGSWLVRQKFKTRVGFDVDLAVLVDDLDGYDAADAYGGAWQGDLGGLLQDALDPPGVPDGGRTLRLAVTGNVGRSAFFGLREPEGTAPFLMVQAEDLRVMVESEGADPGFLWRYAKAEQRLSEQAPVMTFSALDTFAVWKQHEDSFYLSDDRPAMFVNVAAGSAAALRAETRTRWDRHHARQADAAGWVEVFAVYGASAAPVFAVHPRHRRRELLVETAHEDVWVGPETVPGKRAHALLHQIVEAVAYWTWQLTGADPVKPHAHERPVLRLSVGLDNPAAWEDLLAGVAPSAPGDTVQEVPPWAAVRNGANGAIRLVLIASQAEALLAHGNLADRQLAAALATRIAPARDLPAADRERLLADVAPPGPKRMLHVSTASDVLSRPVPAIARAVRPAASAEVMDDLGKALTDAGLSPGQVPAEQRTAVLNMAVEHCFGRLRDLFADLAPVGLLELLVLQDEALLQAANHDDGGLSSRLACFGENETLGRELAARKRKAVEAAVASRFLVEYASAAPPSGSRPVDLLIYDELLATAAEIVSRATLSDAIRYGFTDVRLSLLPSGRLGVSRGDRFTAGTTRLAEIEAEARRALALAPAAGPAEPGRGHPDPEPSMVDAAVTAEFGFTLTELAHAAGELVALADEAGDEPAVVPETAVRDRLQGALGWPGSRVDAFLERLVLRPRARFEDAGPDAQPWKYNRDLSYIRRPLLAREGKDGTPVLIWGVRRTWSTVRYWADLVHGARVKATSPELRRLNGTIRQAQNKAFEQDVADVLAAAGMTTAVGVKKVSGRRPVEGREELGDIDALAADPRTRTVVVAEAKDFGLARNPAEFANEAEKLLTGRKSAAFKTARRAHWAQANLALVLRHLGLQEDGRGWRVIPVVVTSRHLATPFLQAGEVPVVALDGLPNWLRSVGNRRRPRSRPGRPEPRRPARS